MDHAAQSSRMTGQPSPRVFCRGRRAERHRRVVHVDGTRRTYECVALGNGALWARRAGVLRRFALREFGFEVVPE